LFKQLLYQLVGMISQVHSYLLSLNDGYAVGLNDKELHFIIIGLLGMGIYLVVYPLFVWLARRGKEIAIAWIYTFTVIIVITFAIEIGQKISNTGTMEFNDIVAGVVGFLVLFAAYLLMRAILSGIAELFRKKHQRQEMPEATEPDRTDE